jgi:hypothetical protein
MTPILSILIPSIPKHSRMLEGLFLDLYNQIEKMYLMHFSLGEVEILCDDSKSFLDGGLSIGKKRESLVKRAQGKYLVFLDADDIPAPNYVETLVRMCHEDKDVVTFRDFTTTDFYWTLIDMSLSHEEDEQATPDRIVKRRPWLVCPVRSEYAKQFEFPDINYGEDAIWMSQVLTLCKTEVHTDQILRSYKHSSKTSMADQIINAGHK